MVFFIGMGVGIIQLAHAKVLILTDFDNTFVEGRPELGGAFQTTIRIFRVASPVVSMDPIPEGPDELDLTPHDYERVSKYLAPSGDASGVIREEITLENGQKFYPADYTFRIPDSYIRFGALPNTEDARWLIEDLKSAGTQWKGPFFEIVQKFLASEVGAQSVGVITARGHSRETWHHFFTYLRDQGEIGFLPDPKNYHSVGISPSNNEYAHIQGIPNRKVAVLKDYALRLANSPLTDQDEVLSPDGKGVERMHFLVFADDHPENLEKALELFRSLTLEMRIPIKFALYNSGLDSEVRQSGRPRFMVVKSDGSLRSLKKTELKAPVRVIQDCSAVFSSVPLVNIAPRGRR